MTADFHKEGIHSQLWWYPLVAEDGRGKYESHKYVLSKVVKEHPDWLVLGKDGKPGARVSGSGSALPGSPRGSRIPQEAYRKKFIGEWGFDRHQIGQHLHRSGLLQPKTSPQIAAGFINAMADVTKSLPDDTPA